MLKFVAGAASVLIMLMVTGECKAHGSSHPRWRHHQDANGVEYLQCNRHRISMIPTVTVCRSDFHLFEDTPVDCYTLPVDFVVKFAEMERSIATMKGETCERI
jgi:hypothetical protein